MVLSVRLETAATARKNKMVMRIRIGYLPKLAKRFVVVAFAVLLSINGLALPASAMSGTWQWNDASGGKIIENQYWASVDSSADATRLIAAPYSKGIYTSQDSGATWTDVSENNSDMAARSWGSVAMSDDGVHLIASSWYYGVFTSDDSGATWTNVAVNNPDVEWLRVEDVTSSADGMHMMVLNDSVVYRSDDAGATWSDITTGKPGLADAYLYRLVASTDGTHIAILGGDDMFTSNDAGVTWKNVTAGKPDFVDANIYWWSMSISDDGQRLAAFPTSGDDIFTSSDGGTTWVNATANITQSLEWMSGWGWGAASPDGSKIIANNDDWGVYISSDGGMTWQHTGEAPSFYSGVFSADGLHFITSGDGLAGGDVVYVGTYTPPKPTVALSSVTSPVAVAQPLAQATLATTGDCADILTPSVRLLSPDGVNMPNSDNVTLIGGVAFNLRCTNSGDSSEVSLTLGGDAGASYRFYKQLGSGALQEITSQVQVDTTEPQHPVIRYNLTDGGALDEDGVSDGIITDPIFIGVSDDAQVLAETGSNSVTQIIASLGLIVVGCALFVARRWHANRLT